MSKNKHLTFDQIYKYINTDEITEENYDEIYAVDYHISECEECLEKAQLLRDVKILIDEWNPEIHGEFYKESMVKAREIKPEWRERIKNWIEKYSGQAEAAMEVLVDTLNDKKVKVSQIITEGMEAFIRPTSNYRFDSARVALSRGRGAASAKKRFGAVAKDSKTNSKIKVDSSLEDNKKIVIELKDIDPQKVPLIILVPEESMGTPLVQEPRLGNDNIWIAEFERVSSGKYTLMIEPVE